MSEAKAPDFISGDEVVELRTNLFWSLFGVWHRHARVYCQTLLANATPPVLEPLFFFSAVTVGLAGYLNREGFDGLDYVTYVASGILVTSAMATGVFETTYNTFVRITWQKTYDAMLSTHLRLNEVFVGELLFCATKGAAFSAIVMVVTLFFGAQLTWWCLLVPVVGFLTAYLYGAIGLIVTSFVKMINNFAFFTTGVITPMFFFSGTFFPVKTIDSPLVHALWLAMPVSHSVELSRAIFRGAADGMTLVHVAFLLGYLALFHWLGLKRIRSRVMS